MVDILSSFFLIVGFVMPMPFAGHNYLISVLESLPSFSETGKTISQIELQKRACALEGLPTLLGVVPLHQSNTPLTVVSKHINLSPSFSRKKE
jgi:hypothetical protein